VPAPVFRKLIITHTREEAPGVRTLLLEPVDGRPLQYRAGQFLTLVLQHAGREIRRSYSMSSSPVTGEPAAITVRRVENGIASRELLDRRKPGDRLLSLEPTGLFTLPDDLSAYREIFLLAAGIGITPLFSLLKTLVHTHPGIRIYLLYSTRSLATTVFYTPLQELARAHPEQLHIEYICSTAQDLTRARLNKGLLPLLVNACSTAPQAQQLFYVCGPPAYMRMCLMALEEMAYDREQVKKEIFDTQRAVPMLQPPDQAPHRVTIRMHGRTYQLRVQYPDTVLSAARKQDIPLPYSCETGRCGACAAQCVSGKIWMRYNEVLTGKDLAQGRVLTCTGYPVAGDVTLQL